MPERTTELEQAHHAKQTNWEDQRDVAGKVMQIAADQAKDNSKAPPYTETSL
jgi:hypothetical protein